MKVFVAGATGALGRPLVRALVAAGHDVTGTSRSADGAATITAAGAQGMILDALDRDAVLAAVQQAQPEVVIHQATALPQREAQLRKGTPATNRLRTEGTRHLLDAAVAGGARRLIAASIAVVYAPDGPRIASEDDPLWDDAPGTLGATVAAVQDLERAVATTAGIEGVVLRFGKLYGPGTWYAADGDALEQVRRRRMPIVGSGGGLTSFVHVEDAARATVLALDHGAPGVYNIVDDEPADYRTLLPELARLAGAKPPRQVPQAPARLLAGAAAAKVLTEQAGASNAKAKRDLGWTLIYPSWRDGFAAELR